MFVSVELSMLKSALKQKKIFWKYLKVTAKPKGYENLEKVIENVMESHGIWRAQTSTNPVWEIRQEVPSVMAGKSSFSSKNIYIYISKFLKWFLSFFTKNMFTLAAYGLFPFHLIWSLIPALLSPSNLSKN